MKNSDIPYHFKVPEQKKIRLIIDTDAKNEADDQYAIVHALLTQRFDIKGIIGAHFGEEKSLNSMNESYEEIKTILRLMNTDGHVQALHGAPHALRSDEEGIESEGSRIIIEEALKNDPRPLYCIFLGPLTDLASALLMKPEIADRAVFIWIGGGAWPEGGEEYNLHNDITAANIVYKSSSDLWVIPRNVYSMLKVGLAELQAKVIPYGKIGSYLFTQLIDVNDKYADNKTWPPGECWVLGDSAAIGVLLDSHEYYYGIYDAPVIDIDMKYIHKKNDKKIRYYHSIDPRFILEDFYCKLMIYSQKK